MMRFYRLPARWRAAIAGALVIIMASSVAPAQTMRTLPIAPVLQNTPVWCWAAVAEMVLKHRRFRSINPFGDFQCGIVGSLGGPCSVNCGMCMTSIGTAGNLMAVLMNYQSISHSMGLPGNAFHVQGDGALTFDDLAAEINGRRPVIAGISPSGYGALYPPGMSEHVALVIGYDIARQALLVNDPMPYALGGFDPYLVNGAGSPRIGQYWISYDAFVQALGYKDTIVLR